MPDTGFLRESTDHRPVIDPDKTTTLAIGRNVCRVELNRPIRVCPHL
jgi:hypothetical protein